MAEGKHPYPDYEPSENQLNSPENLLLIKSAMSGSLKGVTNAISKGAKPNFVFRPEDLKTALHIAAEHGFDEIIRELLSHGSSVDNIIIGSKDTALALAAIKGFDKCVKILIDAGANVNAGNAKNLYYNPQKKILIFFYQQIHMEIVHYMKLVAMATRL